MTLSICLKHSRWLVNCILIVGLLSACTDHGAEPEADNDMGEPEATVSFSEAVHPLLLENCSFSGCHGASNTRHEFEVTSYETITANTPTYGRHVIPGNADASPLYLAISPRFMELGQPLRMPRGRDTLSTAQQELVRTWINEGALDN